MDPRRYLIFFLINFLVEWCQSHVWGPIFDPSYDHLYKCDHFGNIYIYIYLYEGREKGKGKRAFLKGRIGSPINGIMQLYDSPIILIDFDLLWAWQNLWGYGMMILTKF